MHRADARLIIVGGGAPNHVKALAGPSVELTGMINDEALATRYTQSRVAIVPLRFGAGVKGKVIEALHAGVLIVTTQVGAQGLPGLESRRSGER